MTLGLFHCFISKTKHANENLKVKLRFRRPTDLRHMHFMTVNPRMGFTERVKQIQTEYKVNLNTF